MIFDRAATDNATVLTVTRWRGQLVAVPMKEEELFRKVLGDEEFDRRAEEAFAKEVDK